ncbi:MAG: 30S ribosomal protein S5, partial [Candidatus Omnitrophota bacterium]
MTDNKPLKVNRGGGKFGGRMGAADQEKKDEIVEKVIIIKRVSKVVKGGKRFSFSAMVVAGDEKGRMGVGFGKGVEVSSAIKKALTKAKKDFFEIQLKGSTIPHEILGRCGAAVVLLKPAAEGTGVIA